MPSGIPWLDKAVQSSGFEMADFEAARLIYNQIAGVCLSPITFRRLPIPYRRYHRARQYEVPHVVEAAQKRISEAPIRKPAPRRGRLTVGTTLNAVPNPET
jgi:hypothetical protein